MSDGEMQDSVPQTHGLFIEDNVPGTWLKVAWQGRRPRGWLRWATTTSMSIGVGVWINVLLVAIAMLVANASQRGDAELLAVMTVLGLFLLLGAASIAGSLRGYPERNRLFLGCHGYGLAWPCCGRSEDTATPSRDRGTHSQSFGQVASQSTFRTAPHRRLARIPLGCHG